MKPRTTVFAGLLVVLIGFGGAPSPEAALSAAQSPAQPASALAPLARALSLLNTPNGWSSLHVPASLRFDSPDFMLACLIAVVAALRSATQPRLELTAEIVAWHRQGIALYWRRRSRPPGLGRPAISREVRDLIRQLQRANRLWGAPRIHDERRAA